MRMRGYKDNLWFFASGQSLIFLLSPSLVPLHIVKGPRAIRCAHQSLCMLTPMQAASPAPLRNLGYSCFAPLGC